MAIRGLVDSVTGAGVADADARFTGSHGVVARPVGATNPLPANLTTPIFTLGATANPISYYYLGALVTVSADKTVTLNDGTGAVATSGSLVIGYHYKITTFVAGDDFSNVATVLTGTINTTGCEFTATGTTPTSWANGSSVQRIALPKTYFIYFDAATGSILQGGFPGITGSANVIIATVNWNGVDYGLVTDERHNSTRNREWHQWAHDTIGARWESGVALTVSGSTTSSVLSTTAGVIHDEDIEFAVPASSAFPTPNTCRMFYQTGATTYAFDTAPSLRPYKLGTSNRATYVNSSSSYALTTLPSAANRYVNVFFYATSDLSCPIYAFVETVASGTIGTGYTSTANARAVPWPNLSAMGISPELKPIYRVIVTADGAVQTITSADDYRNVSSLPMSAGNPATSAAAVTYTAYGTVSAGNVQAAINELDDEKVAKLVVPNTQSGAYTLAAADEAGYIRMTSGSAQTLGIPLNATLELPVGFDVRFMASTANVITVTAETGVTLNGILSGAGAMTAAYKEYRAVKTATDTWDILGDITIA